MTRRDMISGIGMLAAVPTTSTASEAASFQIGVCTYSFRDFQRGLAIKMIKQLGVTEISVKQDYHMPFTLSPADVAKAMGEFKKAGLSVTSCGNTDMKSHEAADLRKYFDHAKAAGVSMLVTSPLHDNLDVVEKLAKEYDMRIAIHPHGPEDKEFPSPKTVLDAVKGRDARMGLCLDVAHAVRAGADVVQEIANAGPRLLDMHFKDVKDASPRATYCIVGEGMMPVVAIFRQLNKIGYRGAVNLEWEIDSDNPMPGMLRSLGYMQGVLAALNG
jgi:sugar phosphate isomerase/epimerase